MLENSKQNETVSAGPLQVVVFALLAVNEKFGVIPPTEMMYSAGAWRLAHI